MDFRVLMAETARRQTTDTIAKLYDGKLRLERRNGGSGIYARTYMQGKLVLKSTGETTLHAATKIATDWYLDLRDRTRRGEHLHGRAFAASAEAFLEHTDQVREVSEGLLPDPIEIAPARDLSHVVSISGAANQK